MKGDIIVFIIALGILGGAFAGYLNWLLIQPKPDEVQVKVPPAPSPLASAKWHSLEPVQQEVPAHLSPQWNNLPVLQQRRLLKTAKHYQ
ncbi:MAG: DUF3106 domain-containing protein [Gallionella sp.]|nr:DUF3106 domain-containing protein [Gallionella sp.]